MIECLGSKITGNIKKQSSKAYPKKLKILANGQINWLRHLLFSDTHYRINGIQTAYTDGCNTGV
jgi:GrpB-like predicted nucleotidyltransferase (UPF0157 family)